MGFFSPRLVDLEVAEWQFEYFEWLISNFSSAPGLPDSELWLPTPEHFPAREDVEIYRPTLAEHIFFLVKEKCGFNEGTIFDLVRVETNSPQLLEGGASVQVEGTTACGTYQIKPQKYGQPIETISYDKGMEKNPEQLVATFAHELGHALHNRSTEPVDIDAELYELFTDLTAVYLGFGIFLANSRFGFSSNSIGWQAKGAGYLPEADIVFATALFMKIKNIPQDVATEHLKPRLKKVLKKAFKQLLGYEEEIEVLRTLNPQSPSSKS